VLLTGAGLLIRSFDALLEQELGFDPSDRLALQIFAYDYEDTGAAQAAVDEMIENMGALPGVTDVAITTDLPGATDGAIAKIDIVVPFTIEGRAAPPRGQEPQTYVAQVYRDYFGTMDIEVVAGRTFDATDGPDGTPVIIVNETLARRHFGEADAVGERLLVRFAGSVPREIVGVAADVRPLGHASQPRSEVYLPLEQAPSGSLTFVLRAAADAAALTLPAMRAVWQANPAQSIWGAAPVDDLVADWHKERRFSLLLITMFSVVALTLSAIGLYGLVSFSVERRVGELGIRRALGGRSSDLVTMVVREGSRLAGAGLLIGLAAAFVLARLMRGMLFGVGPTDPVTFVVLSAGVLAVAGVATLAPALRAMRVDPVEALRSE
jgi:putative ABC transport system permease protein